MKKGDDILGSLLVGATTFNDSPRVGVEVNFDFLSAEYQYLFQQSAVTAFQCPYWLNAFYKHMPEQLGAEPLIITVRSSEDGSLLLVLPLVRQTALTAKILQPADLGISDYNAVIATSETMEVFARDENLQSKLLMAMAPYDVLLFRKQRPDTTNIRDLMPDAKVCERKTQSYAVESDTDFETWIRSCMSAKHLSNLRRKLRSFGREVGELVFETVTAPEDIEVAFSFLRARRTERFPEDLLNHDAYFEFYKSFALATAVSGGSVTHIGRVNGTIVSAEFGPVYNKCVNLVLAAFNETDYAKYSIGTLSMVDLLEHRLNRGERCVDFTTGEYEYKRRFKARPTELQTFTLTNGGLGILTKMAYARGGQLKQILKKFSPSIR